MRQRIVEFFATGLYLGKIPVMPGTFGTLLGIPLAWISARYLPSFAYMVIAIGLLIFSAIVAELHEHFTQLHDPGEIVIDEVVGFFITMTWLPLTWQSFVAGFFIFRVLDILKPFPIRQIDRRIPGGLGTTLDDVAAGVIANVILQLIFTQTPWLGAQLHAA